MTGSSLRENKINPGSSFFHSELPFLTVPISSHTEHELEKQGGGSAGGGDEEVLNEKLPQWGLQGSRDW